MEPLGGCIFSSSDILGLTSARASTSSASSRHCSSLDAYENLRQLYRTPPSMLCSLSAKSLEKHPLNLNLILMLRLLPKTL